jgi:nucleotide-binding universal stress UspA family protein
MTNVSDGERPIVVGVSSSDERVSMVRWAAEEAAGRDGELTLVTALPAPAPPARYLPVDTHREAVRRRLTGMAAVVADEWPNLAVRTELVDGPPAEALREAAADAVLLVVGADDRGAFVEAMVGSVPGELLTTAPCPLAVVPPRERTVSAGAPVVVALDGSTSLAALDYGYAAAIRTGHPLTVLHCVPDPSHQAERNQTLIAFRERCPSVAVLVETVEGDPAHVLVAASQRAHQVVLGSRGRGRLASGLFGSVSRTLIRRAGCPVVVARAGATNSAAPTIVTTDPSGPVRC